MKSEPCVLDEDAITVLAEYAGWRVVHSPAGWYFERPFDDYAVEIIHAETNEEALHYLTKIK